MHVVELAEGEVLLSSISSFRRRKYYFVVLLSACSGEKTWFLVKLSFSLERGSEAE